MIGINSNVGVTGTHEEIHVTQIVVSGPLVNKVIERNHHHKKITKHYVVGMMSFGNLCDTVFSARVSGALDWIHGVIAQRNRENFRSGNKATIANVTPITTGSFNSAFITTY